METLNLMPSATLDENTPTKVLDVAKSTLIGKQYNSEQKEVKKEIIQEQNEESD